MRQDPPFDLGYITATHLLERIEARPWSSTIRQRSATRRKRSGCSISRSSCRRRWLLARSALARKFLAEHGEIVLKPLHGFAGRAVFRIGARRRNLASLMELFNGTYREPHVLQPFLPEVAEGDKRIVLVDGEVAGAINRVPGEGEIRSNLAVGGTAGRRELTAGRRRSARLSAPNQASAGCCSSASTSSAEVADRDQRHLARPGSSPSTSSTAPTHRG